MYSDGAFGISLHGAAGRAPKARAHVLWVGELIGRQWCLL